MESPILNYDWRATVISAITNAIPNNWMTSARLLSFMLDKIGNLYGSFLLGYMEAEKVNHTVSGSGRRIKAKIR